MSEPEQLRKARMSFDLANRCRFAVSGIVAPIMQDSSGRGSRKADRSGGTLILCTQRSPRGDWAATHLRSGLIFLIGSASNDL